jgi:hypothetical protein
VKAIVHIGCEKTNASAIQQFLYLNRKKLRKAGFHFVQSAGESDHRAIPIYCVSEPKIDGTLWAEGITTPAEQDQFNQRFISEFDSQIRSLPAHIHTVLISSEQFHSRIKTAADMDNVHRLLTGYFEEIKIVCYLREQVITCTRNYSTLLKSGEMVSFEKLLDKCRPNNAYYNYLDMLENWERCFGLDSLDICLFEKGYFVNGNLLDDFTAKIDPSLVGTLKQDIQLHNESLRPAGQVLARMVNVVFPLRSRLPEVLEFREKCQALIAHRMSGRGQQPDLETWQSIYSRFEGSNEQVRQKFFPEIETLFAEPFGMEGARNIIDDEFTEVLLEIVQLIKESGIDIQMPKVYARLWSVISTCVGDVVKDQGIKGNDKPPTGILNDKDANLLKDIAIRLEKNSPQAAFKLMTLARKVRPNSPVIQKKMAEYSQNGSVAQKSKFIVTYHGGEQPQTKKENRQLNDRYGRWLQSLDIPTGATTMVPVSDSRVLKADSTASKDKAVSMMGFTIFQAESLEQAITHAQKCPHLEIGGTVELSEISPS